MGFFSGCLATLQPIQGHHWELALGILRCGPGEVKEGQEGRALGSGLEGGSGLYTDRQGRRWLLTAAAKGRGSDQEVSVREPEFLEAGSTAWLSLSPKGGENSTS